IISCNKGAEGIKRKKTEDLPIKYSKLNLNIQSTLNKLVEEQLEQRTVINTLQKEIKCEILENQEKSKQHLKRKDIKNMWLDAPMTKAYHKLFQENKNPSDSEIEQAFKLQIHNDYLQKMQELINSNGWDDLWNAAYSVLKKSASPEEVRHWKEITQIHQAILQKTFNKEELQNSNNIIFRVTVILMFLDPTYDQAEISSSKVYERMNKWESDPIVQKW
ncbi:10460_t:CDS:2, partial [Funneliformis caledonium]